jgi:hypothetical protein
LAANSERLVAITLNIVLLAVMFVADHPRVLPHSERCLVVLKGASRPPESMRARLEERLGYEVTRMRVLEIDFDHHRTQVDVRFRTDRPVPVVHRAKPEEPVRAVAAEAPDRSAERLDEPMEDGS